MTWIWESRKKRWLRGILILMLGAVTCILGIGQWNARARSTYLHGETVYLQAELIRCRRQWDRWDMPQEPKPKPGVERRYKELLAARNRRPRVLGFRLWKTAEERKAENALQRLVQALVQVRQRNPVVTNLPGVGRGWLDTLEAVAGTPAAIDTLPTVLQSYEYEGRTYPIGGFYTTPGDPSVIPDQILANPRLTAYEALRRQAETLGPRRAHPTETTSPAGVLAHEFGHRLQTKVLVDKYGPREPGDTLPTFARGEPETFADRFAMAMLELRKTTEPLAPSVGSSLPRRPDTQDQRGDVLMRSAEDAELYRYIQERLRRAKLR